MYLAENYNSPQSVYWCLKSLGGLGIAKDHPFWACEELPYPKSEDTKDVELIWPPRHILCNTAEHHFLTSSGQFTSKRFKAREAKYGKFAYSSVFGFSVPCGPLLEQSAPDSTLAVRLDNEDESWKARWEPYDVSTETLNYGGEEVPTLISTWRPWKGKQLTIRTRLIPPVKKWAGWHVRIHRVEWQATVDHVSLTLVDGGFATSAQTMNDVSIFETPVRPWPEGWQAAQGGYKSGNSALVISTSGASGVLDLTAHVSVRKSAESEQGSECEVSILRADPNT